MKLKREHIILVEDRKFMLREFNGKRKSQLDDLTDQAMVLAGKFDALKPEDIEAKRELRKDMKANNYETYRLFLIPVEPAERTPDEWFDDNFTEGFFTNVVAQLQGALNRYEDVEAMGKSIEAKLTSQSPAETNGQSVGPIFAAR